MYIQHMLVAGGYFLGRVRLPKSVVWCFWGLGHLEKPGLKKQVEFLVRRGLFEPNSLLLARVPQTPKNET